MVELTCICYVSSATRLLSVEGLTSLLVDAREFNKTVQVTGVLLHHDGGFFQYFEGPPAGTAAVYGRIRNSRTHHSIIELLAQPLDERLFPDWLMGSSDVPTSTVLSLQQADWRRIAGTFKPGAHHRSRGLALLQSYWSTVPEAQAHRY